jgi:predicted Zn finger-like uncharacterized protein
MFKVECPGCKAPYQVDERRVPSSGLKMRCPKCGNSFQVDPPRDPRTTGPSPVLGGLAPSPAPAGAKAPAAGLPPLRKATMLGVAGPGGVPKPVAPRAPPAVGPAKPVIPGKTLLGTGVPKKPLPPRPSVGRPLPSPKIAEKPPEPDEVDLPSLGGRAEPLGLAGGSGSDDFSDFGDIGLDLPRDRAPAPAHPRAATPARDEIDLPAVAAPSADFGDFDLPAISGGDPLESAEFDLPVVGGRTGPQPLDLPALPLTGPGGFGDADLPLPAGNDLPAPRADAGGMGFGELDLPTIGSDLPTIGGDLPSPTYPGLPAASAGLPVPSAGLPLPSAGLPVPSAGLPAAAAALPSAAAGLPTNAAGLPTNAAGLPTNAAGLPTNAAGLPTNAAGLPGNFPGAAGSPPAGGGFGEVDLGGGAPPWGAPGGDAGVVRQAGGGTSFGEVNLGGTDDAGGIEAHGGGEEDMEFGGIPQEGQPALGPAVDVVRAPVAGRRAPVPLEADLAPPKRRSLRAIVSIIVVIALGGGSLALVPSIGPFGVFWIIDQAKAGEYKKLVTATAKSVREGLARDDFQDATRVYKEADAASNKAKRLRALSAFVVYVAYARELRFGPDPEVNARAQVLLDEFKDEKSGSVAYLELARAAHQAASDKLISARETLEGLVKKKPDDPDVLALLGEVEIDANDGPAALETWTKLESVEKSARSSYGLARAKLLAGERKQAEPVAKTTLERNPDHAGARILIARVTWNQGGEASATKLLEEVTKGGKASPEEMVAAYTLLGDVHLARSRISQGEAAYSEALKIDPKASAALVGMGNALYRAGRFSEALARFEGASQANAADIEAKVGVVKTTLALERYQDALASIKQLFAANPKSMLVAYWYGRVLEGNGNRKEAEIAFREAIKLGGTDPAVAQPYIGLAMLLNAAGTPEEANKVLADARAKLPDSATIHVAIGDLSLGGGRYEEAIGEYKKALKLDSGDVGAEFQLGVAYRKNKQFDASAKAFDEVAKVDSEYPGLALERGLLFEASGRTEEALKAYEGALAKAPDDTDLMLRVGCGKASTGQAKEAEKLLRKVLEKRQHSPEGEHCLGRALMEQGSNMAEAQKMLELAAQGDPNRAEYWFYVGWAANETNNPARADSALQKALDLDQGLADAYWQRGVLRIRQGAVRDAVRDLLKALDLKPSRIEAHAALADTYSQLGREADSLREWEIAVGGQPDNDTWQFRYGRLLAANHRDAEAQGHLEKALQLGEKSAAKPAWAYEAHLFLARVLGQNKDAIPHWEAYLKDAPKSDAYRGEAKKALVTLGKPWDGD